jgi:hypothetical protein
MTTKRAACALVVAASLGSCSEEGWREPGAQSLPAPVASGALEELSLDLLGHAIWTGLEASGVFEDIGITSPDGPDEWTKAELEKITGQLDALSYKIDAIENSLATAILTDLGRQTISEQTAAFNTCWQVLRDLQSEAMPTQESVDLHNRALLLRAYQLTGLPPPVGEVLLDDYCALSVPLQTLRQTVESSGPIPEKDHFLAAMAVQARANHLRFEQVVQYFAWVVAVERRAMTLMAEAHHRLGEDALLAARVRDFETSLRHQEIELLRAAEFYAATPRPGGPVEFHFIDQDARDALDLADKVVAQMEGRTWFVTATALTPPAEAVFPSEVRLSAPADPGHFIRLDDVFVAAADSSSPEDQYYMTHNTRDGVDPYRFAFPLHVVPASAVPPVNLGRSTQLTFHRFRTPTSIGAPELAELDELTLNLADAYTWVGTSGALEDADHGLTVTLQRLDAATFATEADASRDRALLAHASGLSAPTSRFHVVPSPDDPRQVTLAVDEPSWGLSDVKLGALADAAGFAARPELQPTVFTLEPYGPAEPDRVAFRLGDGQWLGVAVAAAGASTAAPAQVTVVGEPFYFDLTRGGATDELSYVSSGTGLRQYLYVNAQVRFGSAEVSGRQTTFSILDLGVTHLDNTGGSLPSTSRPLINSGNQSVNIDVTGDFYCCGGNCSPSRGNILLRLYVSGWGDHDSVQTSVRPFGLYNVPIGPSASPSTAIYAWWTALCVQLTAWSVAVH